MFLWAMLPEDCDSGEIARLALAAGIALVPGNVFSVSRLAARFLRFNAAQSDNKRIYDFLKKCAALTPRRRPCYSLPASMD